MLCYRDMTFCSGIFNNTKCKKFGECERSLTKEVREKAWNCNLPICQWGEKLECFEEEKDNNDG